MGKKKKIEKAIKSLEKQIKKHKEKILEYEGKKDYLKDYWEGEIKSFKKKKEELKEMLRK